LQKDGGATASKKAFSQQKKKDGAKVSKGKGNTNTVASRKLGSRIANRKTTWTTRRLAIV